MFYAPELSEQPIKKDYTPELVDILHNNQQIEMNVLRQFERVLDYDDEYTVRKIQDKPRFMSADIERIHFDTGLHYSIFFDKAGIRVQGSMSKLNDLIKQFEEIYQRPLLKELHTKTNSILLSDNAGIFLHPQRGLIYRSKPKQEDIHLFEKYYGPYNNHFEHKHFREVLLPTFAEVYSLGKN